MSCAFYIDGVELSRDLGATVHLSGKFLPRELECINILVVKHVTSESNAPTHNCFAVPLCGYSRSAMCLSHPIRLVQLHLDFRSLLELLVSLGFWSQWKYVSLTCYNDTYLMKSPGARMKGNSSDHSHINPTSGTLSLIATPTSNPSPPTSSANPHPAIHYVRYGSPLHGQVHLDLMLPRFSGAVHAKSQITVTSANSYTISGEFSSPTTRGTWPAFWYVSSLPSLISHLSYL